MTKLSDSLSIQNKDSPLCSEAFPGVAESWHWSHDHCRTLSWSLLPFCWEAAQASSPVLLGLPSPWFTPSKADLIGPWSSSVECLSTSGILSHFLSLLCLFPSWCEVFFSLWKKKFVDDFLCAHNTFSPSSKWHFFSDVSYLGKSPCPPSLVFYCADCCLWPAL